MKTADIKPHEIQTGFYPIKETFTYDGSGMWKIRIIEVIRTTPLNRLKFLMDSETSYNLAELQSKKSIISIGRKINIKFH